jgi:hypothetical protein
MSASRKGYALFVLVLTVLPGGSSPFCRGKEEKQGKVQGC